MNRSIIWLVLTAVWLPPNRAAEPLRAEVDGLDLSRGLLHSRMTFAVKPGRVKLWYPRWIPGVHGPVGPIQNMAGLRIETPTGRPLRWTRDDLLLYQFYVEVPEGTEQITVELDYICNQPSVNSVGVDSYGNSKVGIINWNTCLLYPDGVNVSEYQVELKARLPSPWKFATSLKNKGRENSGEWVEFEPASFEKVVDSPLLAGEFFRTVELAAGERPVFLHMTSESDSAIRMEDAYIEKLKELVRQAEKLFGGAPYEAYHFLLAASEQVPTMGLEHLESSLNVVKERDLIEEKTRKQRATYLLPHEYVHSWCGKFRRPAGMITTNYHTDKHTQLLWIYEGLTQYLGELLSVRSGALTLDEYRQLFADKLSRLMHTAGRRWRSLEDTAVVSHQLRGPSKAWGAMRRNQDYYNEGLLFWLEADALIRTRTNGKKSLDDFCKEFFGIPTGGRRVVGYELADVIAILENLLPSDWKRLIARRVSESQEELALDFLDLIGYRAEYDPKPSEFVEQREKYRKYIGALDSLGLEFAEDGKITEVIPDKPADDGGIAPGMKTEGINGRKFSKERLQDALAQSVNRRKIDLLLLEGDLYRNVVVDYDGGPKYLKLARDEAKPDVLERIFAPKQ